ncbi:MAG: hypothetical protein K2H13_08400, partial [Eubacterium sp.]|nr:hypothetical protein [Eubacterium sp.]
SSAASYVYNIQVAQRLNISRSYVSRIEKKVLKDLKDKTE